MARPQAADFEERREGMRDKAARLFAHNGFHATSISDLTQAIGISKSLFYHYFESKEAILYEILSSHLSELVEVADNVLSQKGTPREILYTLSRDLLAKYTSSTSKHVVLLNEIGALPEAQRVELVARQRLLITRIGGLLKKINPSRAKRAGVFASAMVYLGILNWTYTWFGEGKLSSDAFAEMATDIFLNGF